MAFIEFAAVTVAAMFLNLVGAFADHLAEKPIPRKFVNRAFWFYAAVEIGATDAAMAILGGVV